MDPVDLFEPEHQVLDAEAGTSGHDESEESDQAEPTPSSPPSSLTPNATPRADITLWNSNWDAWIGSRPRVPVTRVLLLVRHGHYVDSGSCDGERVLTALGRLQAAATGARLRSRLEALQVDPPTRVVHSNMSRAVQTAQIIRDAAFPALPLVCDPDLREGAPAVPEPNWWRPAVSDVRRDNVRIERAFKRYFHRAFSEEVDEEHVHHIAAAGAPVEVTDPSLGACNIDSDSHTLAQPELSTPAAPSQATSHRAELFVAHGNVIRWLVLRALQLPTEAWLRIVLPHGSITTIAITPDGDVLLQGLGETGHIDSDLVS